MLKTPKKNASVGTLQIRCPINSLSFRDIRNYKYLDFIIISKLSKLIFLSHKICVNKKVVTLYIYINHLGKVEVPGKIVGGDYFSEQVKMAIVCFVRLFSGFSNAALTLLKFGFKNGTFKTLLRESAKLLMP